jgi:hypothetical protein
MILTNTFYLVIGVRRDTEAEVAIAVSDSHAEALALCVSAHEALAPVFSYVAITPGGGWLLRVTDEGIPVGVRPN